MGGEMFYLYLRTDEKPAVIDNQGKIRCSGGIIPADEGISGFHPPGRRTEGETPNHAIALTVDEVADLSPAERSGSEGMIPIHESIPQQGVVSVFTGDGKTGDGSKIVE